VAPGEFAGGFAGGFPRVLGYRIQNSGLQSSRILGYRVLDKSSGIQRCRILIGFGGFWWLLVGSLGVLGYNLSVLGYKHDSFIIIYCYVLLFANTLISL
jgi:hypothetical protein